MRKEKKEIKLRAVDCENLGIQISFVSHESDFQEALNNARLIAAAPDMLEALYCLLDSINGNHVTIGDCNQAIAAIAKATGEPCP